MLVVVFLLPVPAHSQPDMMGGSRIAAWLDYACYDYPPQSDVTLVEFYYGLLRHEMTFAAIDSGFAATAFVWIEIVDDENLSVDTLYKKITTMVREFSEIGNRSVRITDQIKTVLEPGTYTARLIVEDAESQIDGVAMSGKTGERRVRVNVPQFNDRDLAASGLELAYKIELLPLETGLADYRDIDKSNRRVIPNPSRIFVTTDSIMYFYGEVYNLAFGLDLNREFLMACKILDTHGGIASHFGQRKQYKPGNSAIVSSAVDIHDLPEGNYFLSVEVTDSETEHTVETIKPFQLLASTVELLPGTGADAFTEENMQHLMKVLKYVLTKEQKDLLDQLTLEGKKSFIEDFWNQNDPDPSTRLNEYRQEIFRRFEYVNRHYSVSVVKRDDGWETDRGRVYMVYGEPDEIENYPSTPDVKPFEKWNYFSLGSQGARFFIFEDETGYGDYRLAHSDARGEPTSAEWEDRIARGDLFKF
jgi:GWxTD domain-containing protein